MTVGQTDGNLVDAARSCSSLGAGVARACNDAVELTCHKAALNPPAQTLWATRVEAAASPHMEAGIVPARAWRF